MNKRQVIENRVVAPMYVTVDEIMGMFSVGRSTALKIGKESGGTVKIGRSTRYNYEKVKSFVEKNSV